MTKLHIFPDIGQHGWTPLNKVAGHGVLSDIGLLRNGTSEGKASVAIIVTLSDGRQVVGETTWALLRSAVEALAASPLVAEEVIDP